MKASKKSLMEELAAVKKASRRADRERLENGENPEVLQRENSIFPPGFFEKGKFSNLSSVIGK